MAEARLTESIGDVAIRHAVAADLAALCRVYDHYVTNTHVTFDVEPMPMAARREWFRQFGARGRHQLFVAHRADAFLGFALSHPFRAKAAYETSVETTIYLDPPATGQGVGPALYGALLDALRCEDVHRAYGGIALPNPASIALHERMGYRDIGSYDEVGRKFGRYWSVRWYERQLP